MKKEEPLKLDLTGCRNCGRTQELLSMDTPIIAGFGSAIIQKDDEVVYSEPSDIEFVDAPLLSNFEELAMKEPEADWRYHLDLPLRSAVYQRQGKEKWVLIKKGQGFA